MKKILILGKYSFIGSNLSKYLKKFYTIKCLSFEDAMKKNINYFEKYSHVINTSIHKNYIKKKYKLSFDLDRKFILKFDKISFIYIFLNSRKIYLAKANITEKSLKKPLCYYSKNKLITENFLKSKLRNNLLSLRISNIIGNKIILKKRNIHNLFFDNYLKFRSRNKPIVVKNEFKDFLSITQFCKIINILIKKNIYGIYNVSLSKKIFLSEILEWIDKNFYKKIKFIKSSKDSFYLSNRKLIKKIKIKLFKSELKTFCKKILK